jgi:trigger factor
MVTMDVTGRVQDKQVLDWKDSVYVVNEGDAQPFPGFAGHLQDLEVGTPKEFSLEIPSDYADASLAGGEMHLVATLTEVKQRVLPELDDEFAKGVGDGFESLEDLRASVEKDLQDEAERTRQTQYREAALDGLTSAATVELAPLLVEHDIEHMINRRDQLVERLNMTLDDYLRVTGKTDEEIRAEMREHAIERFTRSYALSTLAEREGLEVSGEEIDEKIQAIASSSDENAESLEGKDLDSEEVRDSIRETLLVTKALDRLTLIARGEAKEDIDRVQSTDDEKPESEEEGART